MKTQNNKKMKKKIISGLLGSSAIIATTAVAVVAQTCEFTPNPTPTPIPTPDEIKIETIINGINLISGYTGTIPTAGEPEIEVDIAESLLSGIQVFLSTQNSGTGVIINTLTFGAARESNVVTNNDDSFTITINGLLGTAGNDVVGSEVSHVVVGDLVVEISETNSNVEITSVTGIDLGQQLVVNAFAELSTGYIEDDRDTISSNALSILTAIEAETNGETVAHINSFEEAQNLISVNLEIDGTISARIGSTTSSTANSMVIGFADIEGDPLEPDIYFNEAELAFTMKNITVNSDGSMNTDNAVISNYSRDIFASFTAFALYFIRDLTQQPRNNAAEFFWNSLFASASIPVGPFIQDSLMINAWADGVFRGNAAEFSRDGLTAILYGDASNPAVVINTTEDSVPTTYTSIGDITFNAVFHPLTTSFTSVTASLQGWTRTQ